MRGYLGGRFVFKHADHQPMILSKFLASFIKIKKVVLRLGVGMVYVEFKIFRSFSNMQYPSINTGF